MTRHSTPSIVSLALALTAGFVTACQTPTGVTVRRNQSAPQNLATNDSLIASRIVSPTLSAGDKLRILITPIRTSEQPYIISPHDTLRCSLVLKGSIYRLLPGDQISIEFGADPKLKFAPVVRPDGGLDLPGFGELNAAGKTTTELASAINALCIIRLQNPRASVEITKNNLDFTEVPVETTVDPDGCITLPKIGRLPVVGVSIPQFAQILSDAATAIYHNTIEARVEIIPPPANRTSLSPIGIDHFITISPEGTLTIPEFAPISVVGKSIAELSPLLQSTIRARYANPNQILVSLEASENRVFYIDGEVTRPGSYPLGQAHTVLKALAQAGGTSPDAELRKVHIVRRLPSGDVHVFITNLKAFLEKGVLENDLALTPQDLVLVPKSTVAKANQWVDHYITRMLPFSRSVSYSVYKGETEQR